MIAADLAAVIDVDPSKWVDVNGDGRASAVDALQVINELGRQIDVAQSLTASEGVIAGSVPTAIPVLEAGLLRDTAPGGGTNSDRLTSDPTIRGTTTDAGSIVSLRAGFNQTDPADYVELNVASLLHPDGTFVLDTGTLEQVHGGVIPDGEYALHLVSEDESGNLSATFTVLFTLDTQAPLRPDLPDLLSISDTGLSDADDLTGDTNPRIGTQTEPGSLLQLFVDGLETARMPGGGSLAVNSGLLGDGSHEIVVRAEDQAGNLSEPSATLTIQVDTTAPLPATLDLDLLRIPARSATARRIWTTVNLVGQAEPGVTVQLDVDRCDDHGCDRWQLYF